MVCAQTNCKASKASQSLAQPVCFSFFSSSAFRESPAEEGRIEGEEEERVRTGPVLVLNKALFSQQTATITCHLGTHALFLIWRGYRVVLPQMEQSAQLYAR